jgi:hypothetical protein
LVAAEAVLEPEIKLAASATTEAIVTRARPLLIFLSISTYPFLLVFELNPAF